MGFTEAVYRLVATIPEGKTMTYKEVAIACGQVRAYRAVGTILSKNFDPRIPCHRVIRSDGKIGNYNRGGAPVKTRLLQQEGALERPGLLTD